MPDPSGTRVLGIDPTSRGLGFAVLEGSAHLVDWGCKLAAPKRRNARCVALAVKLIQTYQPDLIAVEDCKAPGSRRCPRVRALIRSLRSLAQEHTLDIRCVGPRELRLLCAGNPRATKHATAVALAKQFPALARKLPRHRSKPWMTEDTRMAIFDALALAVTAVLPSNKPPS